MIVLRDGPAKIARKTLTNVIPILVRMRPSVSMISDHIVAYAVLDTKGINVKLTLMSAVVILVSTGVSAKMASMVSPAYAQQPSWVQLALKILSPAPTKFRVITEASVFSVKPTSIPIILANVSLASKVFDVRSILMIVKALNVLPMQIVSMGSISTPVNVGKDISVKIATGTLTNANPPRLVKTERLVST